MIRYFLALPLLAALKVNLQGYFSRGRTRTLSDVFFLNGMIFSAVAVSMAALFLRSPFPPEIFLWGLGSGLCSIVFQVSYCLAFRSGSISLATIINNFNIALPLLAGMLLFHETLSPLNLCGLLLLSAAFCLIPESKGGKRNLRWLCFTLIAFFAAGSANTVMLIFTRSDFSPYKEAYTVVGYLWAALFCFSTALIFRRREKAKNRISPSEEYQSALRPDAKLLAGVCGIGVVLGLYNLFLAFAAGQMDAVLLYPVVNALTIFWISLSDKVIFHQKFTPRQLCGMLAGVCAVILLNL